MTVKLIEKYNLLCAHATWACERSRLEMKKCRKIKNDNDAGWSELAEYQEAKAEYLENKRVAQIYGEISADLS
jgi:hypothetical protein